jgi:hypothetical protein
VGLSTILRTTEGTLAWRSSIAAASGVLFVALTLAGYWEAASFRADDIDPQVARFAFDVGNVSFANGWLALGSFAVGAGLVMRSSDLFRPWLGWLAIASGGGLVLSRAVWTNEIWLLPYALFWVWVIVVSVLLLRARALNQNTSQLVGRNP